MRIVVPLVFVAACGSAIPATGPCSAADRALIGAHYNARLAAECPPDGKPIEQCVKYQEIHEEYVAKREDWILCMGSRN